MLKIDLIRAGMMKQVYVRAHGLLHRGEAGEPPAITVELALGAYRSAEMHRAVRLPLE